MSKNRKGPRARRRIDVTVGRSATDYLQAVPSDPESDAAVDGAPESALLHPVASEFRRELLQRLEVAGHRTASEADHLDAIERVVADYQAVGRPPLHLLP